MMKLTDDLRVVKVKGEKRESEVNVIMKIDIFVLVNEVIKVRILTILKILLIMRMLIYERWQ